MKIPQNKVMFAAKVQGSAFPDMMQIALQAGDPLSQTTNDGKKPERIDIYVEDGSINADLKGQVGPLTDRQIRQLTEKDRSALIVLLKKAVADHRQWIENNGRANWLEKLKTLPIINY